MPLKKGKSQKAISANIHELMTKPGLGVEIDEKAVRAASKKINRKRFPEWTHKDGSFAEW